jgi:hypothetical protein
MVGWKRIVVTVGDKIGKTHLTYAQGASAELVAMATILGADGFGLPMNLDSASVKITDIPFKSPPALLSSGPQQTLTVVACKRVFCPAGGNVLASHINRSLQ